MRSLTCRFQPRNLLGDSTACRATHCCSSARRAGPQSRSTRGAILCCIRTRRAIKWNGTSSGTGSGRPGHLPQGDDGRRFVLRLCPLLIVCHRDTPPFSQCFVQLCLTLPRATRDRRKATIQDSYRPVDFWPNLRRGFIGPEVATSQGRADEADAERTCGAAGRNRQTDPRGAPRLKPP